MPLDVSAVCAMLRFTAPRLPFTVTAVKITLPAESRSNSHTRWFHVLAAGRAHATAEATHCPAIGFQTRHAFAPFRSHCVAKLYRFWPSLWLTLNSMACAAAGLSI